MHCGALWCMNRIGGVKNGGDGGVVVHGRGSGASDLRDRPKAETNKGRVRRGNPGPRFQVLPGVNVWITAVSNVPATFEVIVAIR